MTAGTVLAGKYRLISMLGHGGMGAVWRAERLGWQSPVAVKLMHMPALQDALSLARFQREAHLAASLRSIHIVQVLDDGVDATTGAPFIVMELLEGETLAERLQRVRRLRAPVVAQIVTQIARALSRAHDAGLIHRDLKPDNILIVRNDDEEVIKVLDFGIAKWAGAPHKLRTNTLAGQMLGTPVYMSPEQFANSATLDHRADLWSLGVIACECMTGVRPFQGETLVALAMQISSGNAPLPSSLGAVPEGFDRWFMRAIARNPKDRFSSARLMAEELRGLCGHTPMLWEAEAEPPRQHSPREQTELEPVLELRRRTRASAAFEPTLPATDLGSVLPAVRSANPPERRRPRVWLGLVALLATLVGVGSVLVPSLLARSSVGELASQLHLVTLRLREKLVSSPAQGNARSALPPFPAPAAGNTAGLAGASATVPGQAAAVPAADPRGTPDAAPDADAGRDAGAAVALP
jgi:eukaryotic-like serine/threonine-protein kinase